MDASLYTAGNKFIRTKGTVAHQQVLDFKGLGKPPQNMGIYPK